MRDGEKETVRKRAIDRERRRGKEKEKERQSKREIGRASCRERV